jgi:hypothetical protein
VLYAFFDIFGSEKFSRGQQQILHRSSNKLEEIPYSYKAS